jgi:serine/threonine-protein kinase
MRARNALGVAVIAMAIASPSHATPTPRFPSDAIWYRDISAEAADPASTAMIRAASIGAGGTLLLKIDFALRLLDGTGAPRLPLGAPDDDYRDACDGGGDVPVPPNGSLEDEKGYECRGDGDCHLLVVDGNTLHEAWRASVDARGVHATCLVRWQLDRAYPEDGRGDQCTSADAAGFPIAPLTFNADEVADAMRGNGDLGHALRFILPNPSMRAGVFVRPATHAGAPKGSVDAIPYGARLRLRADVAIDSFGPAAQVVLRTLRRYGAFVADGGRVPLTAQSDRDTKTKWADIGLGENTLKRLSLGDFEVMPTGPVRRLTYDCRRNEKS